MFVWVRVVAGMAEGLGDYSHGGVFCVGARTLMWWVLHRSYGTSPTSLCRLIQHVSLERLATIVTQDRGFTVDPYQARNSGITALRPVRVGDLARCVEELTSKPCSVVDLGQHVQDSVLCLVRHLMRYQAGRVHRTNVRGNGLLINTLLRVGRLQGR